MPAPQNIPSPPAGAKGARDSGPALLVLDPSGQRSRVPLQPLPFLIGRHADNTLVLRDNRASRNHARIILDHNHYVLEDLNSRHGTWVNGERVSRRVLRNSDRIDLGVRESYQLTFTLEHGEINRLLEKITTATQVGDSGARNLANLRSLMDVARALQNSLSTEEVLTAVVDAALAVTRCERGFLLLRKGLELEVAVSRDGTGRALDAGDLRVPTSVIRRALETRRDLLSMSFDPLEQQGVRPEMTVASLELRSVVCLPLIHVRSGMSEETRISSAYDETVGLLYLDSREAPADLSAGNRELLQTLAIEASTILENSRLIEEERAKIRIEDELNIARSIQQDLLPSSMPTEGWFRAAGSSLPSRQVGGDYFDVRRLSDKVWTAVVADVSGKGVSSALLAGLLQGAFLMGARECEGIELMMSRINAFLLERTRGEKYATVFYCMVDVSGAVCFSNAGHPAPYLVSADGRIRKLHTSGMPVGMLEESTFQTVRTRMEHGDKLVIYSDGFTEAENAEGEFFESERLRVCLRDNARRDAAGLHAALVDAVDRFTDGGIIRDDITALVIEYAAE